MKILTYVLARHDRAISLGTLCLVTLISTVLQFYYYYYYCFIITNHTQITNIVNTNEYLYFQIQLWSNVNTKISNLTINALPTTIIKVDGKSYGLKSVICQHGPSMNEAHYTSIISHQNKWLRCNDTVIHFERWPRGGKNVYIIIMEKKIEYELKKK